MTTAYTIRRAAPSDIETIVRFTIAEAREAENAQLPEEAVRRGIEGAFRDTPLARYWIAEHSGDAAAHVSVVAEWSDFYGGFYWWVQSVYVHPQHRGKGLLDLLLEHLAAEARKADALDLRLYVHTGNGRAIRAYERCGFSTAPYAVMTRPLKRDDRRS